MGIVDYTVLYALQDTVLKRVFDVENEFYLTGGTCLSRFYQAKRYSDDLDFFTNDSARFPFAVKKIKKALEAFYPVEVKIETRDFVRFVIDDLLQVDFVHDRVPRYKDVVVLDNGYVIDSVENILSNKITAVIGRDNPKDIFDIYLIAKHYAFDWKEIIHSAMEKASFSLDDLIIRLSSFPVALLENIHLIDETFLIPFEAEFPVVIADIKAQRLNAFCDQY
jgi:hypothetical protein